MRTALRFLGTRYGAALALVLLVTVVTLAFRGTGGRRDPGPVAPALPTRAVSVAPSGGNDGLAEDDADSDTATPSLAAPVAAEARTTATRFTAAWLHHTGVTGDQWRAGIAPYATPDLMARFARTDPAGVPASSTVGEFGLVVRDQALVETTTRLDNGTLRLGLITAGGHWKVDTVDWERPR